MASAMSDLQLPITTLLTSKHCHCHSASVGTQYSSLILDKDDLAWVADYTPETNTSKHSPTLVLTRLE